MISSGLEFFDELPRIEKPFRTLLLPFTMAFITSAPLVRLNNPLYPSKTLRNEKKVTAFPPNRQCRMVAEPVKKAPFSAKGMTVDDFFYRSFGEWRSQRSSHNLAWTQFEAVTSVIQIVDLNQSHDEVKTLCDQNNVPVDDLAIALKMSWEGESDWDDDEVMSGESVMAVVKDTETNGRLLRSVGYAETIPAVGEWEMTDEGVFVLQTFYDAAAAEERIWFVTPDLRMRVSQIRTSSGAGVVTASFSTEIRRLSAN